MTEYLFGKSTDSLTLEATVDQKAITESIHKSLSNSTTRFIIGSFLGPLLEYIPLRKDIIEAIRIVHDYIDGTVLDALRSRSQEKAAGTDTGHYVFLQEMVKNTTDKKFLRDISLTLYVGGTDTTANILGHTIWALSRHPTVVDKLREEISTLKGQTLDLSALQKLPYLKAVINESELFHQRERCFKPFSANREQLCESIPLHPPRIARPHQTPSYLTAADQTGEPPSS